MATSTGDITFDTDISLFFFFLSRQARMVRLPRARHARDGRVAGLREHGRLRVCTRTPRARPSRALRVRADTSPASPCAAETDG